MIRKRTQFYLFLLSSISLLNLHYPRSEAWARWATPEDTDSEIVSENTDIQVNPDGSYIETIEYRIKILKENARESMTTRRLVYNSTTSSLKVLSAKTINDGVEFPVDPKFLEDKPLASSPKGFDQHNQVLVAFPQVKINSEIYLKYVTNVRESPIPGFFSISFIYGSEGYERSGLVRITSSKPLYVAANDPRRVLKVSESKVPGSPLKHRIEVLLKKPILAEPVDEQYVHLDPKSHTWVDISTTRDWPDLARPMLSKYEEVLNEPLPPAFERILTEAKKKKKAIEQINAVTSLLAESINYLGDWRPISGLYVPRSLATVATTKLADCKDFSAATTSILRRLGIKAHVAWVKRGMGIYESPNNLPILTEFNHAIVRVIMEDKVQWVDPTNFSSFSQGIFPDISDRPALVMDTQNISMERIPAIQPENGEVVLSKNIELDSKNQFQVDGQIEMKGVAAIPYTGISLKASKQSINYGLIKALGDENRITDWSVNPFDLTSRIVNDIHFKFRFIEKDEDLKTSAGPAIVLSSGSYIPVLLTKTTDRVSDLFLGTPLSIRRELHLNKIFRLGNQSLNCEISSPWINATREVSDQASGVQVVDKIVIKKSNIPNSELKTSEFAHLQQSLQSCFNGVAIVYSKEPRKEVLR